MKYYLYLIVIGDWAKFGIAKDIKSREASYRTHNPNFVEFNRIWYGEYESIAAAEKTANKWCLDSGTNNDWFSISRSKKMMEKFIHYADKSYTKIDRAELINIALGELKSKTAGRYQITGKFVLDCVFSMNELNAFDLDFKTYIAKEAMKKMDKFVFTHCGLYEKSIYSRKN